MTSFKRRAKAEPPIDLERRGRPVGPALPADEVPAAGRDDLVPLGDSGEESVGGRPALRTPQQAGLGSSDEDE